MERLALELTRERLFIIALALLPVTVLVEAANIWMSSETRWQFPLGHDFVAFWAAAKLYAEGGGALLYDIRAFATLQEEVSVRPGLLLWHYPPTYTALILPLAGLSFAVGYLAFTVVNVGALAAVGRHLIPFRGALGWATLLGAPVMAASFVQGQNGPFFAACLVGGFIAHRQGRVWLSAVLFALILAKPHFGVLIPVALVAIWDWRAIWRTALCCVAFALAATAIVGTDMWVYFASNLRFLKFALTEPALLAQMPSVWASLTLAGASPIAASIVHSLIAALAATAVWLVWSRREGASSDLPLAALLFATLLMSPYCFRYDMVLTLAGTLLLMRHIGREGMTPERKLVLAALWIAPALFPAIALWTDLQLGPVISMAGLFLCLRLARVRELTSKAPRAHPRAALARFPYFG